MKKSFLTWNKESVDDRKIFKDLDELSEGQIVLSEEVHKLTESRDILARNNTNKRIIPVKADEFICYRRWL